MNTSIFTRDMFDFSSWIFSVTENSVVETENLVVIHKSRPVQSNTGITPCFFGADTFLSNQNLV